eukprot:m51a1_g9710 hypothetical protein (272) ;mRNA; f:1402677-1404380
MTTGRLCDQEVTLFVELHPAWAERAADPRERPQLLDSRDFREFAEGLQNGDVSGMYYKYGPRILEAFTKTQLIEAAKDHGAKAVLAMAKGKLIDIVRHVLDVEEDTEDERVVENEDSDPTTRRAATATTLVAGEGLELEFRYQRCTVVVHASGTATVDSVFEEALTSSRGFNFEDFGHLYKAKITRLGVVITSPLSDGEPREDGTDSDGVKTLNAGKTTLGHVGLKKGDAFTWLFDFGDNWRFKVAVKGKVSVMDGKVTVLKRIGKPPKQY